MNKAFNYIKKAVALAMVVLGFSILIQSQSYAAPLPDSEALVTS